jgi:hypothetical protein
VTPYGYLQVYRATSIEIHLQTEKKIAAEKAGLKTSPTFDLRKVRVYAVEGLKCSIDSEACKSSTHYLKIKLLPHREHVKTILPVN